MFLGYIVVALGGKVDEKGTSGVVYFDSVSKDEDTARAYGLMRAAQQHPYSEGYRQYEAFVFPLTEKDLGDDIIKKIKNGR